MSVVCAKGPHPSVKGRLRHTGRTVDWWTFMIKGLKWCLSLSPPSIPHPPQPLDSSQNTHAHTLIHTSNLSVSPRHMLLFSSKFPNSGLKQTLGTDNLRWTRAHPQMYGFSAMCRDRSSHAKTKKGRHFLNVTYLARRPLQVFLHWLNTGGFWGEHSARIVCESHCSAVQRDSSFKMSPSKWHQRLI